MMNFIFKREAFITSLYTISLSLLISKFSLDYVFGDSSIHSFVHFLILFIIFFNSWLLEVVHLNRYGKGNFLNYFFLTMQIFTILNLILRNTINMR